MADEQQVGAMRAVPIKWVGIEDTPVVFANQFVMQYLEEEFILTFGQLVPPVILGSDEDREAALATLSFVPTKTVGQFAFTAQRMKELVKLLQGQLDRYETRGGEAGADE